MTSAYFFMLQYLQSQAYQLASSFELPLPLIQSAHCSFFFATGQTSTIHHAVQVRHHQVPQVWWSKLA